MQKPSATIVTGAIAVTVALSIFGVLQWRASTATIAAGFWYEDFPFTLPEEYTVRLGGSLTATEIESVKRLSRVELEQAFSQLRIVINDRRDAFWRIRVLENLNPPGPTSGIGTGRLRVPRSGEAYALGPLGGAGSVSFVVAALGAIHYAPPGASREDMIRGIGRGIGRAAAHELGHAALGGRLVHNDEDESSYEFSSWDRVGQYYGELRWTTARPLLEQRFGRKGP
jgi:hypothetical protein